MLGTEEHNLFEDSIEFPDFDAKMRLDQLIGLDDYKIRLTKMLSVLIHPRSIESWINNFHGDHYDVLGNILNRPPLIVLAGDVGSGKTALAENISDREFNSEVRHPPMQPEGILGTPFLAA